MYTPSPPPPNLPPDETFELSLRKHHLEQLRGASVDPEYHIPGPPWPTPPRAPSPKDQLVQWSKDARAQIESAVSKQAEYHPWDIGIFTLLESAAVYLRDTEKVVQAVSEARKRTKEADLHALQLLKDSEADIKEIAALWGLGFEVVCDLLKYSPEGHPFLNGPYCGVFYSKDTSKPFLGLAFKGTNVRSWKEVLKDLYFALTTAKGNILWGSSIHSGFYYTMFNKFPHVGSAPLEYIKFMIDKFLESYEVPSEFTIYLHATGHSLGAAYATLLYAELMRLYNDDPTRLGDDMDTEFVQFFAELKKRKFVLRDLYTFGCPRVGGPSDKVDWARRYKVALDNHAGKSWRVVNEHEPVAHAPPIVPPILFGSVWNHIDNGYRLNGKNPPTALEGEIGTKPFGFNPLEIKGHFVESYFTNLYNASSAGPKMDVQWIQELDISDLIGDIGDVVEVDVMEETEDETRSSPSDS